MARLILEGFDTSAQALAFIKWYDNNGEQDIDIYLHECMEETNGLVHINHDISTPIRVEDEDVIAKVNLYYQED